MAARPDPDLFSKGRVNRAGEWLRENTHTDVNGQKIYAVERQWASGDMAKFFDSYDDCTMVVDHWRATHQHPLTSATMGLRSMVNTCGFQVNVSQRLKRMPTIIDKLRRQPAMNLARMNDIGGCRAVLADAQELRDVQHRVEKNGKVVSRWTKDYITNPKESGYRGVHLIVQYQDRHIELQLRTEIQHAWAVTVERVGSRLGIDLKSGAGPKPLVDLFALIGEAMGIEEVGGAVDTRLREELAKLRDAAATFL